MLSFLPTSPSPPRRQLASYVVTAIRTFAFFGFRSGRVCSRMLIKAWKVLVCVCLNFRCTPLWCVATKLGELCLRVIVITGSGCQETGWFVPFCWRVCLSRQRARSVYPRRLGGVDKGFGYRTAMLAVWLTAAFCRLQGIQWINNRRRENCYSISQLNKVKVLSLTDENNCDLDSFGGFRLRASVAKKTSNVCHVIASATPHLSPFLRCSACNEPEIRFSHTFKEMEHNINE